MKAAAKQILPSTPRCRVKKKIVVRRHPGWRSHSGAMTELLQTEEDHAVNRGIQTGLGAFQDLRQDGTSGNSRATGHAFSADV